MTLRASDLVYAYGRRLALSGASLAVDVGVTALLGPNGAGKTTLLKCLVGLLEPRSGTVEVDSLPMGQPGNRRAAQRRIGYVPQNPQLPGLVRVEDIVGYAGWLSGVAGADLGARVDAVMAELELDGLRRRRVRTLSGGQRQRAALATGLVHDPSVLVLDEPTVGLDPGQRLKVRAALKRIGENRAVLLSTHLTEDVQHVADTVIVLVDGRVRFAGRRAELVTSWRSMPGLAGPGSDFERGYEALVASYGATDD